MSEPTTTCNVEASRYEARIDGELAGVADFVIDGTTITFTHTEVGATWEGRGVGSALARAALDDVRARGGLTVVPRCPFIAAWIERNPDYADLTA